MKKLLLCLTLIGSVLSSAQVLVDDTVNPNVEPEASAILEVRSTDKGFLIPRPDNAPANPTPGLVFYDTTLKCFKGWDGTAWQILGDDCQAVAVSPFISNLTIIEDPNNSNSNGRIEDGDMLLTSYTYTDPVGNNPEGTSSISWYLAEDENGLNEMQFVTGPTFDTTGWEGIYVKAVVKPIDDLGNEGDEVSSAYKLIFLPPSNFPGRINEFHYDNVSNDINEFVEIRTDAGTDISSASVRLVNKLGVLYNETPLSSFTKTTDGTYDYYIFDYTGIQNTDGAGMVLFDGTTVADYVSYGLASTYLGFTSTLAGFEPGNTPENSSLQLDSNNWTLTSGFNTKGAANSVTPLPNPQVQFSETSTVVNENDGQYTITLNVTNPNTEDIQVNFNITENGAENGLDYTTSLTTPIFIPAGATSATYSFTAIDDMIEDAGESVNFTISLVSSATKTPEIGDNVTLTIGILDNDSSSTVNYQQDFDVFTNWSYSVSPSNYNISNDVWDVVNTLSSIDAMSGNFWAMRDLNNSNGGGSLRHNLTFDTIDITGETGVVFSFDYESQGLNQGSDRYGYEIYYDGVSQGQVNICAGCNNPNLIGNVSINVPDNVNTFSVKIYGQFDGGDDIVAVDNIKLINN